MMLEKICGITPTFLLPSASISLSFAIGLRYSPKPRPSDIQSGQEGLEQSHVSPAGLKPSNLDI